MAQKCTEPGCNGTISNGLCQACGALYDGSAPVPTPAASFASASAISTHSSSSKRSVSARPSSLSSVAGGTSSRRSKHSGQTLSTRRSLGGGLVKIDTQPDIEPLKLIHADLRIPDNQRICSNPNCVDEHGNPTKLKLEKGFCPKCRTKYSFVQIDPGTVVSGQYEVKGPIAMGGCGFVYLGWDLNVERFVVLKGLINSMDAVAAANAVKEKKFLSNLRDPNIVDIVNFVNHDGAQYIVMELVNGVTLKDIRKKKGPLPVTEAIAYTLGILPSFEFLHSKKIIYCDFKMDNAMVQQDRIRLIDLGGARQENDLDSDLFLTVGYCAPEAEQTVSYSSDLYTVGRTLAILLMDFDFRGVHKHSLPTPQEVDIFAQYESLYRFLLRSTATNPDDRFQSANEMSSQLEGVLREIVSLDAKAARPAESLWFGMDMHSDGDTVTHESLPVIRVNKEDPAKGMVESAMALNELDRQKQLYENATKQFPTSTEAPLRLANVLIDMGEYNAAQKILDKMAHDDPFDWRIAWSRGRQRLAQKLYKEAYPFFDAVYSELPGELAPKLSLGMAAELVNDYDAAIRLYDLVSTVDPGYTTAAFGLARCMAAAKDRRAAVEAYARVPTLSIAFVPSRLRQVRTLIQPRPSEPGKQDLADAAATLEALKLDGFERYRLEADIFLKAIWLLENGRVQPDAKINLLGQPMDNVDRLRTRAEEALRKCAKFARNKSEVLQLIDEANSVRPRTTF